MVEHTFVVRNTTGARVTIRGIRTSCTCTSATLSDHDLDPGERAELRMVADVPRVHRDNRIGCSLETNSETHPHWDYELRFRSYGRVGLEQTALDLGTLDAEATSGDGPQGFAWAEAFAPAVEEPPRLRLTPLDGPVRARLEGPVEHERRSVLS